MNLETIKFTNTGNSILRVAEGKKVDMDGEFSCCMNLKHYYSAEGNWKVLVVVKKEWLNRRHKRTNKFMNRVAEYINSLGLEVEAVYGKFVDLTADYMKAEKGDDVEWKDVFLFRINADKLGSGDATLAAHSLIRATYKASQDGLWEDIFRLRDMKKLSHLDNYEIYQLAEYKKPYDYYWGLLNYHENEKGLLHQIISLEQFKGRINEPLIKGINEKSSIYLRDVDGEFVEKIRKMYNDGKYLTLYNKMKVPEGAFSHVRCVDDEGKEDFITMGKIYQVVKPLKNKKMIFVKNDNGRPMRLKRTRFTFI